MLIGYIIRIKKKNTSDYKPLKNFDGNSSDFGKLLYDFLKAKSGYQNIEDIGDQKTIFYGDLDYYSEGNLILPSGTAREFRIIKRRLKPRAQVVP